MFKTNSEYQKKLLKRWAPMLEKGTPIDSVEKKLIVAQCLENTRKEFTKKNLFTEAAPTAVNNTIDYRAPAYTAPIAGQGVLTQNDYILPNVGSTSPNSLPIGSCSTSASPNPEIGHLHIR